uniref:GAG-pre-integrase domain-containing protein n=1 Tax=Solanum lycopersicum TaxID=4081 RepID=A0A3Q7GHA3_SOLLC
SAGTLNLSQELYIEKVLSRFRVNDAKPRTTPLANHFKLSKEQPPKTAEQRDHMTLVPYASAVGSLMYAMVCIRPDIAHAVGVVSRYMANPGKKHWEAVKWLLRYLRGTSNTSLCFGKGKVTLQVFVDADLGGDVDSRKSTSGYIYTIGGTTDLFLMKDLETKGILHTVPSIDGLYSFQVKKLLSPASFPASLGVWHAHLAHTSYPIVHQALSTTIFRSSKSSSLCTACAASKSHKVPFSESTFKTSCPLDSICSDVWGPAPVVSNDSYRYYV